MPKRVISVDQPGEAAPTDPKTWHDVNEHLRLDKFVDLAITESIVVRVDGEAMRIDGKTVLIEVKRARSSAGDDSSGEPIDFYALVERAAQELLERKMPSEARDYYTSIGPWVTGNAVRDTFGVSWQALKTWRDKHALLGVEFADGKFYYPAKQFKDGTIVNGLSEVLKALVPGFGAPASRAGWLARPAYVGESATRWDVLRKDGPGLVAAWAREDAKRVATA